MEAKGGADPLIGTTVAERYRVEQRIARGGMGFIYHAVQIGLGRDVALKVMHSESDRDAAADFAQRMLNEAAAAAKLSHPNTIVIHDYGHLDDGRCFIAMERIRGKTLGQLLAAEGPLGADEAVHIALQITGSLAEAHAAGMIHRDLKPGNIMLTQRGADEHFVKVLDFGLVKKDPKDAAVDESGALVGTPRYMAPEQVVTEPVSEATDVYSLGATLYHVLSGRPPFESDSRFALMAAHVTTQPRPMAEVSEAADLEVPEELEAVVMRCLQKDPADRYQSMTDLADALLDSIGEGATATMRASLPLSDTTLKRARVSAGSTETDGLAPIESPRSGARAWIVGSGALVAAAALGALVFWSGVFESAPDRAPSVAAPSEPPTAAAAAPAEPAELTDPEPPPEVSAPPPPVAHEVTVSVSPESATLHRGDDDLGDSPLTLEVPAGERWTIEVREPGYRSRSITLTGAQREVHVRLVRRPRSSGARGSATRESTGSPHRSDNRNPWADEPSR